MECQIARDHIPSDRGCKRDQIALYTFRSFLVEAQTKQAT